MPRASSCLSPAHVYAVAVVAAQLTPLRRRQPRIRSRRQPQRLRCSAASSARGCSHAASRAADRSHSAARAGGRSAGGEGARARSSAAGQGDWRRSRRSSCFLCGAHLAAVGDGRGLHAARRARHGRDRQGRRLGARCARLRAAEARRQVAGSACRCGDQTEPRRPQVCPLRPRRSARSFRCQSPHRPEAHPARTEGGARDSECERNSRRLFARPSPQARAVRAPAPGAHQGARGRKPASGKGRCSGAVAGRAHAQSRRGPSAGRAAAAAPEGADIAGHRAVL